MIRVGVLGYGYWGPNLVRNLWEVPDCRVVMIAEPDESRRAVAARRYPSLDIHEDPASVLESPGVDAVAIATPVFTHFELARRALRAGKHVLVEKPLASTSHEALTLIEEAERRRLILMVDHTFLYSAAVRKIKELVDEGMLGDVYYYDATRLSLGPCRRDQNVVWDLAIHDLAILDYVLPGRPSAVSATGVGYVPGGLESVGYIAIHFDNRLIAHVTVNWLAPVKVRQTLVGGSLRMILYDDVEPSEKLKLYDRGVRTAGDATPEDVHRLLKGYRTGDMSAPRLDLIEPLYGVVEEFVLCIATGSTPTSDGQRGLRLLRILEAASESMRTRGRPVELEWNRVAQ